MKNSVVSNVGWLLIVAVLGFYVYGIYEAVRISWPKEDDIAVGAFHEVLSTTVGTIQAMLLANLGVILGISIAKPNSAIARQVMLNPGVKTTPQSPPPPMDLREKIQLFALVIYVLSLITCLITWIVNNFSSDPTKIISLIPESGKMFIGVVLAYLTAVLNNNQN